jgi:hypothetical protein
MRHYVLYLRKCPGVSNPRHFKIGIAALDAVRSRLATYQNAVGPVWNEEFLRIWLGEDIDVKESEKKIKYNFKHKISSAEAGLSEWICDIEMQDILEFIRELREDHFIKLVDAPSEFQPLSMPICDDLQEWYLNSLDNK